MQKSNTSKDRKIEQKLKKLGLFPSTSAPWQQKIINKFLSNVVIKKNDTCLDIACGIGNNVGTIICYFNLIRGIDKSEKALKYAKNRYKNINNIKISFDVKDLFSLSSEKRYYNCVICTEALEHVVDYQKAICEIYSVTKRGGYAIISFQNHFNLATFYKIIYEKFFKKNWDAWGTHSHKDGYENYLNCFQMKKAIKKSGFTTISEIGADYLNAWFFWIPFLYKNYKILNKFPLFIFGEMPVVKYLGMDYFILLKKD